MLEVKRKEGESPNALLFRFTKRVKRSGLLREAKKRRFHDRPENRQKRRLSALHRISKQADLEKENKNGFFK
jgi:ribosomal protein S21